MSGYHNYSMSNNAIAAYESGEKPKSKWNKSEILEALPEDIRDAAKRLTLSELRDAALYWSSWHHTSSMYNRTDFYSVNQDLTEETINAIIESREPKKVPDRIKAEIVYGVWTGTKKHPKLTQYKSYAIICGDWLYLPDGTKIRKDRKHLVILQTFKKAPKGTAAEFKKIEGKLK